jgi:hypothetical protein
MLAWAKLSRGLVVGQTLQYMQGLEELRSLT